MPNDNYLPFPQSNPTRRCPAFGFAWRHCRSHSQLDQTAMKIETVTPSGVFHARWQASSQMSGSSHSLILRAVLRDATPMVPA